MPNNKKEYISNKCTYVQPSQLSVLNYANHFTMWHYKTRHETILCPGYFDPVADILRENDMIIATTNIADVPKTSFYIVLAKAGEHIVVSPMDMGEGLRYGEEDCAEDDCLMPSIYNKNKCRPLHMRH